MLLTTKQFKQLFPANREPEGWTAALNAVLPKYGITTGERLAAFLSQCGHESQGFTVLRENLNYSADALRRRFGSHFPGDLAEQYARQPERIANRVYAGRMGNGPEESGDGWRFRGYGPLQITGRDNRSAFARAIGKSLEEAEAYILTKEGGVESACWFWTTRSLNFLADARRFADITKRINGGLNGLEDRKARYAQALTLMTA